jgi:PAS domain S-box-containing protein
MPTKPSDDDPYDATDKAAGPLTEAGQGTIADGSQAVVADTLFEKAPLAMFMVDRDRRLCRLNEAAVAMTAKAAQETIGLRGGEVLRCVNAFSDPRGCGYSHACRHCVVRNTVMDTFETGRNHQSVEAPIPFKSESADDTMWVLVSTTLLKTAAGERVLVCLENITERKQAEAALRQSELKFRLVTETITDVFWMSTCGVGEMIYISPSYEKLWERSREELHRSPQSFVEAIHPDDRQYYRNVLSHYHARWVAYTCEYRLVRSDGSIRWIQEKGFPVKQTRDDGHLMAGVCTDITDRKRTEAALKKTNDELRLRSRLANLFLTAPDDSVFAEILDLLRGTFESRYGYFGFIDGAGHLVCPSMTRDIWDKCRMPDKAIVFTRDCWGGLWGKSLIEKVPLRKNDRLNLPDAHVPLQNVLVAPLLVDHSLVGQIALGNKPTDYTAQDQADLMAIAEFLAPILRIYLDREKARSELHAHADQLRERNIALKVLLENRDEEKAELSRTILRNFERLVFPYYERMKHLHNKEELETILDIVAANTMECLSPLERAMPKPYRQFTPMEIQVADLIKAGKTSKEISGLLNISPRSVFFHRHNIRKKLKLHGTKTNLRSHLKSLS